MKQNLPEILFLSFGVLFVILLRIVLKDWEYAPYRERCRNVTALILWAVTGFAWHSMNESDIERQEALSTSLGHSYGWGDPPIYVGWPYQDAAFTVIERSSPMANDQETVITRLRQGKSAPIIVFHKDEMLRAGDTVITSPDGRVFIKRLQDDRQHIAGK